ncbi:MAG: hypothetical protein VKJ04_00930 [Vampirovibrionales bacterium]|nr:hypothetical protein [Vampirovibrionales bacterium]
MVKTLLDKSSLDLKGLTVLTECASGPYAYTPVIARLAGAKVYALGRDSSYGKFSDNKSDLELLFAECNIFDGYEVITSLSSEILSQIDIITNSGFVRPIGKSIIQYLKPTAVLPLMWETWEFRNDDLDLKACQEYGIAVIGTNEKFQWLNMYEYPGMLALKLLFDMGIEAVNNHLILMGGGLTGSLISETFNKLGLDFDWFTPSGTERLERCYSYQSLSRVLDWQTVDAIVCAEHADARVLAGKKGEGLLDIIELSHRIPHLRWGHLCGNINKEALEESGLYYYPKKIMPFGYMTYETMQLGIRPVLELNCAGLKVGEIASRARLSGKSIEKSIAETVSYGIGQDFVGGFLNYGR